MYFSKFPLIPYQISTQDTYKLVPDILRRVKMRASLEDGAVLFDRYDVKENENPEDVAFKWFGSPNLHWVILMTNNVTDRYYDWPLNQVEFAEFLTDKYAQAMRTVFITTKSQSQVVRHLVQDQVITLIG